VIGFAVSQVVYGPVSDRHGRRPVLLAALAVFLASTLACAASQSVDLLIGARFLQGIGGSGSSVLSCAIMRDLYSGLRAARELSLMGSIAAFAPIVAPMIGGAFQTAFGWRANFIFMTGAAIITILSAARLLSETLRRRSRKPTSLWSMVRVYGSVLRHRGFLVPLGIITFSYAGLFAWISDASVVFRLSPRRYGGFAAGICAADGRGGDRRRHGRLSQLLLLAGYQRCRGDGPP
jgi:MFS transporter, DHA1 family, multidrug resistance protein